jgi:DNA polymerase III epsilon subunit-like protein
MPYYYEGQPFIVQLGAVLSTKDKVYQRLSLIIHPAGREIGPKAIAAHGITQEEAELVGLPESDVACLFQHMVSQAHKIICHNVRFDVLLAQSMFAKQFGNDFAENIFNKESICTMTSTTDLCKIRVNWGYKWPTLTELHQFLFDEPFVDAHDALSDVMATRRCYYELCERGYYDSINY